MTVAFERSVYSFNEDDGTVSVTLTLSGPISEDVSVIVFGGMQSIYQ